MLGIEVGFILYRLSREPLKTGKPFTAFEALTWQELFVNPVRDLNLLNNMCLPGMKSILWLALLKELVSVLLPGHPGIREGKVRPVVLSVVNPYLVKGADSQEFLHLCFAYCNIRMERSGFPIAYVFVWLPPFENENGPIND